MNTNAPDYFSRACDSIALRTGIPLGDVQCMLHTNIRRGGKAETPTRSEVERSYALRYGVPLGDVQRHFERLIGAMVVDAIAADENVTKEEATQIFCQRDREGLSPVVKRAPAPAPEPARTVMGPSVSVSLSGHELDDKGRKTLWADCQDTAKRIVEQFPHRTREANVGDLRDRLVCLKVEPMRALRVAEAAFTEVGL